MALGNPQSEQNGSRLYSYRAAALQGLQDLVLLKPINPIADSSSINAVTFSSACTTKRFPSSRSASATKIVRPLASTVATQPQLHPALLRLSVSNSARRSEADDFAIEPALQFLREAFEVNQLAVEPVHRQLTAQLLDEFAQFDGNLLSR